MKGPTPPRGYDVCLQAFVLGIAAGQATCCVTNPDASRLCRSLGCILLNGDTGSPCIVQAAPEVVAVG